jgi:hypothetical protein
MRSFSNVKICFILLSLLTFLFSSVVLAEKDLTTKDCSTVSRDMVIPCKQVTATATEEITPGFNFSELKAEFPSFDRWHFIEAVKTGKSEIILRSQIRGLFSNDLVYPLVLTFSYEDGFDQYESEPKTYETQSGIVSNPMYNHQSMQNNHAYGMGYFGVLVIILVATFLSGIYQFRIGYLVRPATFAVLAMIFISEFAGVLVGGMMLILMISEFSNFVPKDKSKFKVVVGMIVLAVFSGVIAGGIATADYTADALIQAKMAGLAFIVLEIIVSYRSYSMGDMWSPDSGWNRVMKT